MSIHFPLRAIRAALGTPGLNATPHAQHLRVASWCVGSEVLVVWSQSMCAPQLALVRLPSLEALALGEVQEPSRSAAWLPPRSHLGWPRCPLVVWPLLPRARVALHLLYFAKSQQSQLVGFVHEVLPD